MSLTWPTKDPDEVIDYEVDWSARLAGDTISTSTFTLVTAAGLTKNSESNTTTTAKVWLSAGTAGQTALIRNRITTAGGRTLDEEILLPILTSLVVEDGTGKADADSYISLADADLYHARRGNSAWTALTSGAREAALRKAADYMVQAYRTRWAGVRVSTTQALDWPRYDVPMQDGPGGSGYSSFYASDEVPEAVRRACAELALKASASDLTPDLTQAVKRKRVGQVEVEYQDYSRATKTYRSVDGLLAPFLTAQGGGLRVVRA